MFPEVQTPLELTLAAPLGDQGGGGDWVFKQEEVPRTRDDLQCHP